MDRVRANKEIQILREQINHHDYCYYVLNQPEISDKEYDDLMRSLKDLESKFPELLVSDSPTQRVSGKVLDGFKTVQHPTKMLSLDNTYSPEELKDWDDRVKKGLGSEKYEYVVELKIDGASASLAFQNGILVTGATRGDGETGEEVTANIRTLRTIPLRLLGDDAPSFLEVRGEIYMPKSDFEKLNKERMDKNETIFANPRNAAAGSLKLLDSRIVAKRNLACFIHSFGAVKGVSFETHWDFLQQVKMMGLRINPNNELCKDFQEVVDYCKKWEARRDKLDYEVDGVVVKINSLKQQQALGSTLKSPRWAVAFKFAAHQATTVIDNIEVQVGRTGVLTPVAKLKPVSCGGVTISNATLHNFDEIERLGIKIGDRVVIERAGEVIPKVVKVVESVRTGKEKSFRVPKVCPVCDSEVTKDKEEDVAYRCVNPSCPAQIEKGLIHFASRGAMDIEGMGESAVSQLVAKGLVRSFSDIYKLRSEDLLKLELFKEKKATNLLNGIERSKARPLWRLIYGLGIPHVGEKAAFVLANRFGDIDKIMQANQDDLTNIDEIGPVMSESIINFLRQDKTRELIAELKKFGLNTKEKIRKQSGKFNGKTFVFTGELDRFSRQQASELVRNFGGNVSLNANKEVDFVVIGKEPGSKYAKAVKLGLRIINESEFLKMIGEKNV